MLLAAWAVWVKPITVPFISAEGLSLQQPLWMLRMGLPGLICVMWPHWSEISSWNTWASPLRTILAICWVTDLPLFSVLCARQAKVEALGCYLTQSSSIQGQSELQATQQCTSTPTLHYTHPTQSWQWAARSAGDHKLSTWPFRVM